MPPAYVKAYVKRNRNDAADAEAIYEAVTRPSRRFVPVKDVAQRASVIAATVSDPNLFRSGREFAPWLGVTPRQNSSGGKERLGRTKQTGRQIHPLSAGGGGRRHPPACAQSRNKRRRMGARASGAKAGQSGRGRARQQNRPHCLGGGGAWRSLPSQGDRRASSLKGLSVPQDCEGEEEVMVKRSSRGSGRPG
jgi:transposase